MGQRAGKCSKSGLHQPYKKRNNYQRVCNSLVSGIYILLFYSKSRFEKILVNRTTVFLYWCLWKHHLNWGTQKTVRWKSEQQFWWVRPANLWNKFFFGTEKKDLALKLLTEFPKAVARIWSCFKTGAQNIAEAGAIVAILTPDFINWSCVCNRKMLKQYVSVIYQKR